MIYDKEILDENEYSSILDGLAGEAIFTIEKVPEGFLFVENCDNYFQTILTKEQMIKLSDEIRALADKK